MAARFFVFRCVSFSLSLLACAYGVRFTELDHEHDTEQMLVEVDDFSVSSMDRLAAEAQPMERTEPQETEDIEREELRACMAPPLDPTDAAWLKERAQGGVLTLTTVDWAHFSRALNWAMAARDAGVNYAFICLDESSKKKLEDSGERCVQVNGGFERRSCVWAGRIRTIRQLTGLGVDVLQADLDALLLADPRPYLAEVVKEGNPDVAFQRDGGPCMGFAFFRATTGANRLLNIMVKEAEEFLQTVKPLKGIGSYRFDDQGSAGKLFDALQIKFEKGKDLLAGNVQGVAYNIDKGWLKVAMLPNSHFVRTCPGAMSPPTTAIVFHCREYTTNADSPLWRVSEKWQDLQRGNFSDWLKAVAIGIPAAEQYKQCVDGRPWSNGRECWPPKH